MKLSVVFGVCLAFLLGVSVFAFAQNPDKPGFSADRHVARGLQCAGCHGAAANAPVQGDKCLACHTSIDAVAAKTSGMLDPNPHDGHMGELECTVCHHGHKATELQCRNCHANMVIKRKAAAPAGSGAAAK
jgi:hypothetical protein